jgi:hypothetical protein
MNEEMLTVTLTYGEVLPFYCGDGDHNGLVKHLRRLFGEREAEHYDLPLHLLHLFSIPLASGLNVPPTAVQVTPQVSFTSALNKRRAPTDTVFRLRIKTSERVHPILKRDVRRK